MAHMSLENALLVKLTELSKLRPTCKNYRVHVHKLGDIVSPNQIEHDIKLYLSRINSRHTSSMGYYLRYLYQKDYRLIYMRTMCTKRTVDDTGIHFAKSGSLRDISQALNRSQILHDLRKTYRLSIRMQTASKRSIYSLSPLSSDLHFQKVEWKRSGEASLPPRPDYYLISMLKVMRSKSGMGV
ncbi:hypothetical protein RF11_14527 [Thelohanellus kitauei]|uniref:Uncharacterized protein n=1 Tax=Thelohanellus kitauei TaxID=669202 RepID=A0A0C2IKR8_THEKT|nr:hypothetical protein RF11_14527 [Thelohanellus kitauei]